MAAMLASMMSHMCHCCAFSSKTMTWGDQNDSFIHSIPPPSLCVSLLLFTPLVTVALICPNNFQSKFVFLLESGRAPINNLVLLHSKDLRLS